jgi:hypothetical protein
MSWKKILKFNTDNYYPDDEEDDDMAETPFPSHFYPNKIKLDGQVWFFLTKLGDYGVYADNRSNPPTGETITVSIKEAEAAKI